MIDSEPILKAFNQELFFQHKWEFTDYTLDQHGAEFKAPGRTLSCRLTLVANYEENIITGIKISLRLNLDSQYPADLEHFERYFERDLADPNFIEYFYKIITNYLAKYNMNNQYRTAGTIDYLAPSTSTITNSYNSYIKVY
jgi:hypothetical protein